MTHETLMGHPKTFFFLNAAFLTTFCFSVGGPLGALAHGQRAAGIHYHTLLFRALDAVINRGKSTAIILFKAALFC